MKHQTQRVFYSLLLLILISCGKTGPDPRMEQPEEFLEVLEAHGNWQKWIESEGMSYTLFHESNLQQENHFFNLTDRKARIDAAGFQVGNDGEGIWVAPNRQSFGGQSVDYYHNLYFYFYSMPYILTDTSIQVSKMENRRFNGKEYERLEAKSNLESYRTPANSYEVLIDPETQMIEWVLYRVTFFNPSNQIISGMKYEDYRETDGMKFPRLLTGYLIDGDTAVRVQNQVSLAGVTLTENELDEDIFEMPEKAAVRAN
ncbi:hypothetical protein [Algoriphagus hitonicola]|uniref:Outer membrane lipoprotein-sorting protein n=1 Tax=Algoriphagus hitonicola TaxID=435880 RepID=A0A1I2T6L0_9BACT|nr:hypothetical protein [Algoriphagus hitonicola]SFG60614.1 hypothetical protein SAMN04487988_105239 [Algoriphagus hitonicola]